MNCVSINIFFRVQTYALSSEGQSCCRTDQGQGDCVPSGSYREKPFAAHL